MKKLTPLIFAFLVLMVSCNQETAFSVPENLEEKRALLKTKQAELNTLKDELSVIQGQFDELKAAIDEQDPAVVKKKLITTLPVVREDVNRYTQVQGSIRSEETAAAVSEVPGRITKVTVKEGDYVRKGQLIATIDLESIDKQEAELKKALELAVEVHTRQKRLWDQNIGSEIQYLQAKNNKERLEKSLESLSFQKGKSTVTAPISGTVEMVMTKQGEVAAPGLPIVQILNTSRVKVVAEAPETLLKAVKKGAKIKVEFPALGSEITVPVSRIGQTINPSNRTFEVEANLNNRNGELKPNLLAIIHINDFTAKDVITLPLNMIQQEVSGKKYVMTVGKDNLAEKAYLTLGESFDGKAIVEEGISESTLLIDSGARNVSAGDVIEISK